MRVHKSGKTIRVCQSFGNHPKSLFPAEAGHGEKEGLIRGHSPSFSKKWPGDDFHFPCFLSMSLSISCERKYFMTL